MTRALLTLCVLSAGCSTEPCALTAEDIEPAHRCEALRCNAPDSITDWSEYEDIENDQWDGFCAGDENCEEELWYGRQVNYATCEWDCIAIGNGKRARVTQTYRKAPGECIELIDKTVNVSGASCDRECETVRP